jgi:methylenetetrahydrofolate reductase (NADPH)
MYLGINNIVALRGDAMKGEKYFEPSVGGHKYASDLVKQIHDLGIGEYLHGKIESDTDNSFALVLRVIQKHIEAPSMNYDLQMLKKKVEAGADYIVTQMFFDNQKFFDFVKQAREIGIDVPIIPELNRLLPKHICKCCHRFSKSIYRKH